jgi:hypothetical protein
MLQTDGALRSAVAARYNSFSIQFYGIAAYFSCDFDAGHLGRAQG